MLTRYGRYEKNRDASGRTGVGAAAGAAAVVGAEAASLIDLSDSAPVENDQHLNSKLAGLSKSLDMSI